jgi:hypothetical protein
MLRLQSDTSTIPLATARRTVLIGSASYCQVRVPELPRVAAVAVRYTDYWMLHNLHDVPVRCNGLDVEHCMVVSDGDRWEVGPFTATVLLENESTISPKAHDRGQLCTLTITDAQGSIEYELRRDALIGHAPDCEILLPPQRRLKPKHCLLTCQGNRWHLIDLTGRGGIRKRIHWDEWIILNDGDEITLEPLRIAVRLRLPPTRQRSPEATIDFLGGPPEDEPSPGGSWSSDAEGTRASPEGAPPLAKAPAIEPESPSRPETAAIDVAPTQTALPVRDQRKVREVAQSTYNMVKSTHLLHARPKRSLGLLRLRLHSLIACRHVEDDFLGGNTERAFRAMAHLLERDAWNRSLLMTFARMCDAAGFDELCLYVLIRMHQLDPDDSVVNRSLARICGHLGVKTDSRFLGKSIEFWNLVCRQHPEEADAIQLTIDTLKSELRASQAIPAAADFARPSPR